MQATAVDPKTLGRDLHSLFAHVMRNSSGDVFRVLGDLDLSVSQVKALHFLDEAGGEMPLGALAERVGISLPAASRAVDALLARGFVERREDPEDRRARRVRILAPGLAVTRQLLDARLSHFESFAAALPSRDAERLAAAVSRVLP